MSWLIKWLLGDLASVVDAIRRWIAGEPVDVFVTWQGYRLKITAQGKKLTIDLL